MNLDYVIQTFLRVIPSATIEAVNPFAILGMAKARDGLLEDFIGRDLSDSQIDDLGLILAALYRFGVRPVGWPPAPPESERSMIETGAEWAAKLKGGIPWN